MEISRLDYDFPDSLIAMERARHSRAVLVKNGDPVEMSPKAILGHIQPEDTLVINTSKVIPARVFSDQGFEILFLSSEDDQKLWKVLCPARQWPKGESLALPGGVEVELVSGGIPQTIQASKPLGLEYFKEFGDVPLPPYIQKSRGFRASNASDRVDYQTDWATDWGSLAAPTASFHFQQTDLETLKDRGISVVPLHLHVGLGTFLPIHSKNLKEHKMHGEEVFIPKETWGKVQETKKLGGRVWALGSTVTRALESVPRGLLQASDTGHFGETDLFLKPGDSFNIVDVLMTNFHQPKSTLLAMVMAFSNESTVNKVYQWAIGRKYRLFSYGDLSVWM